MSYKRRGVHIASAMPEANPKTYWIISKPEWHMRRTEPSVTVLKGHGFVVRYYQRGREGYYTFENKCGRKCDDLMEMTLVRRIERSDVRWTLPSIIRPYGYRNQHPSYVSRVRMDFMRYYLNTYLRTDRIGDYVLKPGDIVLRHIGGRSPIRVSFRLAGKTRGIEKLANGRSGYVKLHPNTVAKVHRQRFALRNLVRNLQKNVLFRQKAQKWLQHMWRPYGRFANDGYESLQTYLSHHSIKSATPS
jgi:hypothetical protein